ncbi:hypothetical protein ACH51_07150 [Ralstonia solanacearum]|nr:hypothetical protein ACH51_07150 [Ralstonia solanacearum]
MNGEEAFGAVMDAIAAAKHSIDIICWASSVDVLQAGHGPRAPAIGDLLKAMGKRGVNVRLLV